MGDKPSKHIKAEPPLFDEPWRKINWRDKKGALEYINSYKPQTEGQQLRILLHGPVGAGKSSFINSVQSVLKDKMCTPALAANTTQGCFTKQYKTYKMENGTPNSFYPFVLNDMMGLKHTNRANRKIHVKDMKRALRGHVKDGYTFNPECKLSKDNRFYNKSPTSKDKVHVLVSVIDASTEGLMSEEVAETLQDIRDEASELGIPQVAIFTKIDEACPEIKRDVKNVYRSKVLKKRMEEFSAAVGIPMNCIFPVRNYSSEISFNSDADTVILNALYHIISFGEDFLRRKQRC
ncbi:interferon-induced protein 44-like [Lates japonicus]